MIVRLPRGPSTVGLRRRESGVVQTGWVVWVGGRFRPAIAISGGGGGGVRGHWPALGEKS